ncbi:hypothetical protein ACJ6WD_35440 [Streptomyces sp. VTCC 41912]|uniref:hypothetical protein n=1 Tax=Streptomyces sp. VTCC 41912 TaxID=3383243 RepID=UPI0038969705
MAKRTTGDEDGGNRLFIASAAIILIVVLLGVFVVVTSGDDKDNAAGPQPTGSSTPTSGAQSGAGDGQPPAPDGNGCTPTDTNKSVPTTAPDDVTWDLVNTVALPRSKSAGPLKIDGKTASCYAHTPRGALMAAANGFYRSILVAPDVAPLRAQALPGPARDALEQQLKKVNQPVQSGQMAQIAGFRIVSYTDATTVVSLVNGSETAHSLKSSDITVQWSGGDWKIVPPPTGGLNTPGIQLTSLDGYIRFGGV